MAARSRLCKFCHWTRSLGQGAVKHTFAKGCKKGFGFAIEVAPVKLCPSQVCEVKSAKTSEREESSGLERKAWAAGEAEPGEVGQVLEIVNSLLFISMRI